MEIIILPKGKDKKHHKILKDAIYFLTDVLISKRDAKKIKSINIKLATSIDYGTSRGDCRQEAHIDGSFDLHLKLDTTYCLPDMIATLAHEMVHIKQVVKGELVHDGDIWIWKDKKMIYKDAWYNDFTIAQQRDRLPWEDEAYGREKILAKKFFIHYFNKVTKQTNE